jgi:hypothetical protein
MHTIMRGVMQCRWSTLLLTLPFILLPMCPAQIPALRTSRSNPPRSCSSDMSKKKRQRAEAEAAAAGADPSGAADSRTEQEEENGAPSAKRAEQKTKTSAAIAAAASAAASASILPPDADEALRHFHRRCQQIRASDDLARVAVSSRGDLGFRSQLDAAVDLLLADADRKDGPLIDLNYRVEGKGTLLMVLIQLFASGTGNPITFECDSCGFPHNEQSAEEDGCDDPALLIASAVPHLCTLIRLFYNTSVNGPDGLDTLSLLVSEAIPESMNDWSYLLAEALLGRGADVNIRFSRGGTMLMQWCADMSAQAAYGPLLLLSRGADIDARDDEGRTAAHWMASRGQHLICKELAEEGWWAVADLTLLNNKGETALQVAQRKLQANPENADKRSICNLLREHASLWKKEARPLLHRWLSHSLLIPDVADIVLSYVDGKKQTKSRRKKPPSSERRD